MADETADPRDRPSIKPFEDADQEPPVPAGEPSRTTEEAARRDLAIRGATAGGAQSAAAGYGTGAMTGTGGAIGAQLAGADTGEDDTTYEAADQTADEAADDEELNRPEGEAGIAVGPPDTPGIDEPVGPSEVGGPDRPDA